MTAEGSLAAIDEVYAERNAVMLALAIAADVLGWTVGFIAEDPEWPVVLIDLPTGQVSWHVKAGELPPNLPPYPGEWDGHDHDEKDRRLARFVGA